MLFVFLFSSLFYFIFLCNTCACAVVAHSNYGLIQGKQENHYSVKLKM